MQLARENSAGQCDLQSGQIIHFSRNLCTIAALKGTGFSPGEKLRFVVAPKLGAPPSALSF
jgi:hypothetical protein